MSDSSLKPSNQASFIHCPGDLPCLLSQWETSLLIQKQAPIPRRFAETGYEEGAGAAQHVGLWVPHSLYEHLVPLLQD